MARVNQGKYKKYRDKCSNVISSFDNIKNDYFPEGFYNEDCDFISDFSYAADSLYIQANKMAMKLEVMLEGDKFESERIKSEYMDLQNKMESIGKKVSDLFLDALSIVSIDLTEKERKTLEKFQIFNT